MGQKVHPHGFRLGYLYDWNSKWYSDKEYTGWLHEDLGVRRAIAEMLKIPVGTVRSRLHRGRALLQRKLWEIAVDEGLVPARPAGGGRRV